MLQTTLANLNKIQEQFVIPEDRPAYESFKSKLNDAINGKLTFTFVLNDPYSQSSIEKLSDEDPDLLIDFYFRQYEEKTYSGESNPVSVNKYSIFSN